MTVFLGLVYPLAITGISQVVFPGKADGSKVSVDGRVVGSQPDRPGIQGQAPTSTRAPRRPNTRATSPSSATPARTASKRAKKSANTSKPTCGCEKPFDQVADQRQASRSTRSPSRPPGSTPTSPRPTPGSRRTGSPPSASCRSTQVEDLISANTDGRSLGLLGEPGVNVLELNIALDKEAPLRMTTETQARSLFDPEILRPALLESVRKLDPRVQVRNPVMFVVEIGAVITTVAWLIQVFGGEPARRRPRARLVHLQRHRLALADGRLRQPRRGAGRGPRPRPGGEPAGDAHRDDARRCATAARSRPPSWSAATSSWSRRARRSPATAP